MKNNLDRQKKSQMVVLGAEVCFNKNYKNKKTKHVFCKHEFCFKLKKRKNHGNELRNRNGYMCIHSLRRNEATEL